MARKKRRRSSPRPTPKRTPEPPAKRFSDYWLYIAAILCVTAVVLYVRFRLWDVPLDRDEGTYLYMAKALLQGQAPYIDFYEIKPPGIFFTYAIFHLLFGASIEWLHIGLALLNLATAFGLFRMMQLLGISNRGAWIGSAAFLIFSLNQWVFGFGVLSEHFNIIYAIWAFVCLFVGLKKAHLLWLLASGFLFGWGVMTKQQGAVFVVAAGVSVLVFYGRNWRGLLRYGGIWAAGGLLSVLVCALIIWLYGSWDAMIYWMYERPRTSYISSISFAEGKTYLAYFFRKITRYNYFFWVCAAAGLFAVAMLRLTWWARICIWSLLILSVASIFPGFRFYGHYWILMTPALGLLVGCFFEWLRALMDDRKGLKRFSWILPVAFIIGAIFHVYESRNYYFRYSAEIVSMNVFGTNLFPESKVLGDFLRKQMRDDDELFVIGSEPQIYYYADRVSPQPHVFIRFATKPGEGNVERQQEIVDYLRAKRPEYLVHVQEPFSWGIQEGSNRLLYNWVFSFEQNYYTPIAIADRIERYRTHYVHGTDALHYQPRSTNYMIVYKRKQ